MIAGLQGQPVGVDIVELPFLFEMQKAGVEIRDAQQLMLDARQIKNPDELMLLSQAAAMVDGVYQDIFEALKPGVRENEIVALANKRLYEMGSDQVEAINAVSGERCNPHPHNFTDRIIRPGDQAFFDIIHSYNGYRTCYYRTMSVGSSTAPQRDAYAKARAWMDGRSTSCVRASAPTRSHSSGPRRRSLVSPTRWMPSVCSSAMVWDSVFTSVPIISRLNSLRDPIELQAGMVFALETYCPASDGVSAARIEEEIVVTEQGPAILTNFPAQELMIANSY
jgi:Xaa-Pro aminopeptidase